MKAIKNYHFNEQTDSDRRSILKSAIGVAFTGMLVSLGVPNISYADALTKEERDRLTPDQIIEGMKKGNARFRSGKIQKHNYLAQKKASANGQYPSTVILSCMDLAHLLRLFLMLVLVKPLMQELRVMLQILI